MEEIKSTSENHIQGRDSSLKKIGNFIKEARLSRDQSIEELASDLKIGAHQLKAIEDGNEEQLPEEVFVKAMVRRISQKLKLDTAFIMNEFDREIEDVNVEDIVEEISKNPTKPREANNLRSVGVLIFILISGFLGLIASFTIFNLLLESFQKETPKQELLKKN